MSAQDTPVQDTPAKKISLENKIYIGVALLLLGIALWNGCMYFIATSRGQKNLDAMLQGTVGSPLASIEISGQQKIAKLLSPEVIDYLNVHIPLNGDDYGLGSRYGSVYTAKLLFQDESWTYCRIYPKDDKQGFAIAIPYNPADAWDFEYFSVDFPVPVPENLTAFLDFLNDVNAFNTTREF